MMAYPQGINFRATLAFVTDGANEDWISDPNTVIIYPYTTVQGNTVGWEQTLGDSTRNRNSGIDRRLAGVHFNGNSAQVDFRLDLPSASDYNIRLAAGDDSYGQNVNISLLDTTTSLGALSSGTTSGSGKFKDAVNTEYSSANWPGSNASVTKTFATTICRFRLASGATNHIAHAYVEVSSGGAPGVPGHGRIRELSALGWNLPIGNI